MASLGQATVVRKAFLGTAVLLQIAAWFSVFYALYYVVPVYKKLIADFPVNPPASFSPLVTASDFVVISGYSDAVFPWLLVAFLIALIGLNVVVIKHMAGSRARSVWCTFMLVVPACILTLEVACLAAVKLKLGLPLVGGLF
jgi:hypothetical protein